MNLRNTSLAVAAVAGLVCLPAKVHAQGAESQTVTAAIEVLQSFTDFRTRSIPTSMLADAQAVAIIPNVVKGGFIIAGRFGRGVVLVRDPNGMWRAPVFVTFTGGSVGWQVGLQSTDVVLVFKNRKGVETMLSGSEFTLGADASIAAGPVGRQASAGTDVKLNAEIYSYSRSRGLFAGVALDGSVLKVDNRAGAAFYLGGMVPPPAQQLVEMVARDTVGPATTVNPNSLTTPPGAPPLGPVAAPIMTTVPPSPSPEQLRQALFASSERLGPLVDESWQNYLSLPPQLAVLGPPPSPADLTAAMRRYGRVIQDPAYRALADRPEFHETYDLLRRYTAAITAAATPAAAANAGLGQLPPPPIPAGGAPVLPPR